nr:MAG TPA: hypothetical protein [Caudoviricetes sp.]DAV60200.1 MAG TPA: hypothetical protein [Caudoviricetes sp.]
MEIASYAVFSPVVSPESLSCTPPKNTFLAVSAAVPAIPPIPAVLLTPFNPFKFFI